MSNPTDINQLRRENANLQLSNTQLRQHQEQLVIKLLAQEQTIAQLQSQVTELKHELEQRPPAPPAKPPLPPFIKSKRSPKPKWLKPTPSQPRQQQGRRHEEPTRRVELALEQCPSCAYHLSGQSEAWRHQVIDLPAPQRYEVVEYVYIKRYCPHCGCYCIPTPDLNGIAIGQARFGVQLTAKVGWLRTVGRWPLATIVSYLHDTYQLTVSEGEVSELLLRLAEQGAASTAAIYEQLMDSASLHIDETSWKLNGKMGYIWTLANAAGLRYYHYSPSRAAIVAQKLLQNFKGVFHSDFYAAYDKCEQRRQCCWVHLLRDLHELEQEHGELDVGVWVAGLQRLYRVGKWLGERDVGQEVRERWYTRLVSKLHALASQYAGSADHPAQTLSQRLLRYERSMFTYVAVAGVKADNNLAERSIRPLAVARKISGGSRSGDGVNARMRLHSLFGTWLAQGLNPLRECLRMLGAENSFQPL